MEAMEREEWEEKRRRGGVMNRREKEVERMES
jgi:hypothetical protein